MGKKSFNEITNPALNFITPQGQELVTAHERQTDGVKGAYTFKGLKRGRKPSQEETKTKRLNLLMFPSVCDDINKIATMKRTSVNDLINSILQDYVTENADLLEKYADTFGEDFK